MKYVIFLLIFVISTDVARRANEAYEKGDYAVAEQAYLEAIRETPDDARLYFNLGNSLAQQGKFDEAVTAFEKFKDMSDSPEDRSKADYNIGNIFGNQEKWDKAAEQFRQSLRQNPTDPEAKYNYELANRLLQEQEQEQQQQQDQDQQNQDENSEGEQQQSDQQQQEGDQDQQDQQQNQQNESQDQQGDEQQQQERQQAQSEMTEEEADRILNALDNKEKDLLKNYHKNKVPSNTRHAKNW
jgi:Ca-activated chloride channel family protein